jgi:hypothetical protein
MDAQYGHAVDDQRYSQSGSTIPGVIYEFLRNGTLDARNFFYLPPPGSSLSKDPLAQYPGPHSAGRSAETNHSSLSISSLQLSQGVNANNVVASAIERKGFRRYTPRTIRDRSPDSRSPVTSFPANGLRRSRIPASLHAASNLVRARRSVLFPPVRYLRIYKADGRYDQQLTERTG